MANVRNETLHGLIHLLQLSQIILSCCNRIIRYDPPITPPFTFQQNNEYAAKAWAATAERTLLSQSLLTGHILIVNSVAKTVS